MFKLTAQGNESVLWPFHYNGTDGFNPEAGLIMDTSGNLHGTTADGGAYGAFGGTVLEISNVVSTSKITVTPRGVVFRDAKLGSFSTAKLLVRNTGTGQLIGTVNTPSAPFGRSGSGSFNLAPKTATSITLTFTPASTKQILRAAKVASNANHSTVPILLEGTGTP